MLPDVDEYNSPCDVDIGLNAPTGAWCSLTRGVLGRLHGRPSQCTYRCVVLPDEIMNTVVFVFVLSQCTYRCVVLPDVR